VKPVLAEALASEIRSIFIALPALADPIKLSAIVPITAGVELPTALAVDPAFALDVGVSGEGIALITAETSSRAANTGNALTVIGTVANVNPRDRANVFVFLIFLLRFVDVRFFIGLSIIKNCVAHPKHPQATGPHAKLNLNNNIYTFS
jgi:hypothetical protein